MRGYSIVALENPKIGKNVGGAIRAARCYGSSYVVISGRLCSLKHKTSLKGYRHIPIVKTDDLMGSVPLDCDVVGIEFENDAECLFSFTHPERAFYVFGPEDGSVSESITTRVYVPTAYCMNLAATVNVVLYDRAMKAGLTLRV